MSTVAPPQNNGLHQTGRGGVAFASRLRPVVEARPAGEPGCWTDRGTDRRVFVPPPSEVAEAPAVLHLGNGPALATLVRFFHRGRSSLGSRPGIFQHPVGRGSAQSFPSASLWLGVNGQTANSGVPVVSPRQGTARPSNKGLNRTSSRTTLPACRLTLCSAGIGMRADSAAHASKWVPE